MRMTIWTNIHFPVWILWIWLTSTVFQARSLCVTDGKAQTHLPPLGATIGQVSFLVGWWVMLLISYDTCFYWCFLGQVSFIVGWLVMVLFSCDTFLWLVFPWSGFATNDVGIKSNGEYCVLKWKITSEMGEAGAINCSNYFHHLHCCLNCSHFLHSFHRSHYLHFLNSFGAKMLPCIQYMYIHILWLYRLKGFWVKCRATGWWVKPQGTDCYKK